jgi:hypothetical protein
MANNNAMLLASPTAATRQLMHAEPLLQSDPTQLCQQHTKQRLQPSGSHQPQQGGLHSVNTATTADSDGTNTSRAAE